VEEGVTTNQHSRRRENSKLTTLNRPDLGLNLEVEVRVLGVSNGLTEFKSARKIWPLLELLAKIR